MATIIPGTINGVANTSTFLHKPSLSAITATSTSSVHLEPATIKAFNTAPIYKTVPVSFYANNNFIGTATFNQVTATLVTTALGTGSNVIKAVWPGEGRFKGFTATLSNAFVVYPAYNWGGTFNISGSSGVYQLNTSTLTATLGSGTTVTGTITFKEKIGTTTTTIGSASLSGRSASIQYPVNNLGTSSRVHSIIAEWSGGRVDGTPYYAFTSTNTLTQTISTASLTLSANRATITVADPVILTSTANTSSVNYNGIIKFSSSTGILSTSTLVAGTNNTSATIPPGTFSSGTYAITSEYVGANPNYPSNSVSLTVNERGTYSGSFTLTAQTAGYQLDNQTFVLTNNINTATSGDIYLQEVYGANVKNISTATFTQQNITFTVNPNKYGFTTATNVHNFRVYWGGQTWIPNVLYPYNEKYSNTVTQTITTASLILTSNTSTYNITLPITLTADLNTTTNYSKKVTFVGKRNAITYGTAYTATNSMSVVSTTINTSSYRVIGPIKRRIPGQKLNVALQVNVLDTSTQIMSTGSVESTWIDGVDYGLTRIPDTNFGIWQDWPVNAPPTEGYPQFALRVNTQGNLAVGQRVTIRTLNMNLVYSASTSSANINAKPWSNGAFVPASSRYLAGGLGLIRGIYNQNGETWILIETSSATQIAYPLTYPKLYPSVYTDDSWIINPQGSNSFFRSLLDIWTFSNSFTNTNYIEIVPYTTGNGPAVATTYPYISNELTQLITTVTTNAISIDSVVAPGTFSTSSVETSFGVQTAATWNLSASINDTAPLTNSNVLTYKIQ